MSNVLVSYIIPTYNAEKYLSQCLDSIFSQDYPKNKYEVLIAEGGSTDATRKILEKYPVKVIANPKRDAEKGKNVAYKHAKGDYLILLDADNIIVGKNWLRNLIKPMLYNPDLIGMESNYLIANDFTSINKYANLLVIVDPVARMMASRPLIIKKRGYVIKQYPQGSAPVSGANGFLWRRSAISKLLIGADEFGEATLLLKLARQAEISIGNIPGVGIYHYYCETLRDYMRKRKKIAKKQLINRKRYKKENWIASQGNIRLVAISLYLLSFILPLIEGLYFSLKSKRISWMWHSFISFLTVVTYGYFYTSYLLTRNWLHATS